MPPAPSSGRGINSPNETVTNGSWVQPPQIQTVKQQVRKDNISKQQNIIVYYYPKFMTQWYNDSTVMCRDIMTDLDVMCSPEDASTDTAGLQEPYEECCLLLGKHQDEQLSPSRNLASMPTLCYKHI